MTILPNASGSASLLCLLALLAGGELRAQTSADERLDWSKAREVTTERKLQTEASASRTTIDQLAGMKQPLEENVPTSGHSLYAKSIILYDGEMFTLVPVGSVLHLPPNLRNRVIPAPRGDFTIWPNFVKRNSTWLAGKEVPLKMAKGDAKLAEVVLKEVSGSSQLLVSVYKQCPISVLEAPRATAATSKR